MTLFFYRLIGAAMLDRAMYEGIEADRSVTPQAAAAVLLASLAAGFGAGGRYGAAPRTFVIFSFIALATWIAWAVMVFHVGTRILPGRDTKSSVGELLRTTGFAAAPGLLQIFAIFPLMTIPVFAVTWVWMFAAMVTGVRHALDYQSTFRALAVCAIAAGMVLAMAFMAGVLFGPTVS
ncbi:MAG: YIP1 family protein [Acidobacteriota bacterium]